MTEAPPSITCVECGGIAHLSSYLPEDGLQPGDLIAYACEDCDHRHDLEVPEGDGP